jgi:hypothetical protein
VGTKPHSLTSCAWATADLLMSNTRHLQKRISRPVRPVLLEMPNKGEAAQSGYAELAQIRSRSSGRVAASQRVNCNREGSITECKKSMIGAHLCHRSTSQPAQRREAHQGFGQFVGSNCRSREMKLPSSAGDGLAGHLIASGRRGVRGRSIDWKSVCGGCVGMHQKVCPNTGGLADPGMASLTAAGAPGRPSKQLLPLGTYFGHGLFAPPASSPEQPFGQMPCEAHDVHCT